MVKEFRSANGAQTAWFGRQVGAENSMKRGTLMVFTHANGFCKELWFPVWDLILEKADTNHTPLDFLCLDLPGHGDSAPFDFPLDLNEFGRSVLRALEEFRAVTKASYDQILAVGHSIGGSASIIAQVLQPTFQRMLLMEPIMQDRDEDGKFVNRAKSMIASSTLKRRAVFTSRKAALENWRGKGAYKNWPLSSLEMFVKHALRDEADGTVRLKCDPKSECESYTIPISVLDILGRVGCPVRVLVGSESTHMPVNLVKKFHPEYRYPSGYEIIPGGDHFVPMVNPDLMADRIVREFSLPRAVEVYKETESDGPVSKL